MRRRRRRPAPSGGCGSRRGRTPRAGSPPPRHRARGPLAPSRHGSRSRRRRSRPRRRCAAPGPRRAAHGTGARRPARARRRSRSPARCWAILGSFAPVPLDLAVQIVNYRTKAHLGPCLEAVLADLRSTPLEYRVLVRDNASGDDLSELAAALPGVEFEVAESNDGFGAAENALAQRHDARVLLALHPDAVVSPGTAAGLHALLAEPRVPAAGPRLVDAQGRAHTWDHGELRGARARLASAAGHSHPRERAERADVAWVSGACAAISHAWFDAVGGFDPGFFLYKEEEDLCLRMRRLGARVVYAPELTVRHEQSVTGARDEHLAASVRRFRDKHVRTRVGRAVLPRVHRDVVAWEGRARKLVRGRR